MSQVESVALWAGLISSIVGIVLSIVAIVFTWVVNRRADKISDHTIQSLQKIESAVEGLSSNTNELIKAAWDKMLGNVTAQHSDAPTAIADRDRRELAAGIAAEIKEELGLLEGSPMVDPETFSRVEQSLERLEVAVQTSTAVRTKANRFSELIDMLLPTLRQISPEAFELIAAIRNKHLTASQYRSLRASVLGHAVAELRDTGLLSPHVGYDQHQKESRVYFIPNGLHRVIDAAISLLPPSSEEIKLGVNKELIRIGYLQS
jgi:hypothetical protein